MYISPNSPGGLPGLADRRSAGRSLESGEQRRWSQGLIGYLPAGARCLGLVKGVFPAPIAKMQRAPPPAGGFRISTGETRYGPMRGRIAAASRALPGNSAARAGGIDHLRTPPPAAPPRLRGVVMGFTFKRARVGFAATYVFLILEGAHRGCAADAPVSCTAQYAARWSPPKYIWLPANAACAVYTRYTAYPA